MVFQVPTSVWVHPLLVDVKHADDCKAFVGGACSRVNNGVACRSAVSDLWALCTGVIAITRAVPVWQIIRDFQLTRTGICANLKL